LTADGSYTYSWNAEQHLNSAANVTYTYDGDLKRVEKSSGTLYWYCAVCGNVLAESDLSGNVTSEYALFNRQRIARRDVSSGNVYYIFTDRLGSYRTLTDSTGNVKGESDYYPFGGERVISSTVTDGFRFTGIEWDSEDGLNHTQYRQQSPALGRWETPDPKGGKIANPQSLNRYAHVLNNPTNLTDASGLDGNECFFYYCGPPDASYDINYDPNSWMLPNNIPCIPGEYACGTGWTMGQDIFDQLRGEASPEERYLSIIDTGWDPILEIDWNTFQFSDPGCGAGVAAAINTGIGSQIGMTFSLTSSEGTPVGSNWDYTLQSSNWSGSQSAANAIADYINNGNGWAPGTRTGVAPSAHAASASAQWNQDVGAWVVQIDNAHLDLINPNAGPLGAVLHFLADKAVGTIWQATGGTFGCHASI